MGSDRHPVFRSPFKRPWMIDNGAAAPAAQNTGIKGIIAGIYEVYDSNKKFRCIWTRCGENKAI